MERKIERKRHLEKEMDYIISRFPEYCALTDDYPENLTHYQYACFTCIQIYIQYHELFIPIMLPHGSYLLEGTKGIYGHTHTKIDDSVRIWELIKFTPQDIMNRQITGKITFTRY